ncbi:MAG: DMT family transporter [Bacteroidota bacterium]|nr:DMT family transporter [Bacteroidota bacterium]
MNTNNTSSASLQGLASMHIATLLFGFTAILGKLITLNALSLVWWRMGIATLVFMLIPSVWKGLQAMSKVKRRLFLINGSLVALHWITFYGAIKIGDSASLVLGVFGMVAFFTAILEPWIIGSRFRKHQLALGVVIVLGLFCINQANPEGALTLNNDFALAIGVGLLSAFLAALFSVFNKKWIGDDSASSATALQMLGGFLTICLFLPFLGQLGSSFEYLLLPWDWFWMIILAVLCTNLAFSLEMTALKSMSAFTANIILNLEPIYGVAIAALALKEYEMLNGWFYVGTALIIATVFINVILSKRLTS